MLKINNYDLSNRMMRKYEATEHCWNVRVVDSTATNSQRESCRRDAQSKIDKLEAEKEECQTLISDLETMLEEIAEKKTTISDLESNFSQTQSIVTDNHVNVDVVSGNKACIQNMSNAISNMENECNNKLNDEKDRLEKLKSSIDAAKAEKDACSNITIYKTEQRCGWW